MKGFLPKMASADADLRTALRDGLGENLNLENVKEDEKYIEMDVAVMDVSLFILVPYWYLLSLSYNLNFLMSVTINANLSVNPLLCLNPCTICAHGIRKSTE